MNLALTKAKEAVGGRKALAARLTEAGQPITPQALWFWEKQIPAERVAVVSKVTGIPKHELRPDLWDPPE